MDITINEKTVMVPPVSSLASVMEQKGVTPAGIAVALNGEVVPPALWQATMLKQGDSIIIFKAFYGG